MRLFGGAVDYIRLHAQGLYLGTKWALFWGPIGKKAVLGNPLEMLRTGCACLSFTRFISALA
jgi:hypothetical protein